jgi:hypothetical protein
MLSRDTDGPYTEAPGAVARLVMVADLDAFLGSTPDLGSLARCYAARV